VGRRSEPLDLFQRIVGEGGLIVTSTNPMPVKNADFANTGPGTLAGRYLRSFWQPVARSQDVSAGRALPVRIMSEDLAVYRGASGQAFVLDGRCAHRGAPLSVGWVEGDAIRCRYHGWCFGGDGRCTEQPGEDAAFAHKVSIRSFPTREYLGLVFAFLGDGEAPDFRRFPDFERDGVVTNGPLEVWPCNYFNRIDNACDIGHVSFTHRASLERVGMNWQLALRTVHSEETAYGIRTAAELPGRPVTYFHFHMPNTNQTRSRGRIEGSARDAAAIPVDRLFWRVPIDDANCVSFVVDYLPLSGADASDYIARRAATLDLGLATLNDTAAAVLAGRHSVEDVDPAISTYKLFWIEDYTVQVGQPPITERSNSEHLGQMDSGVILLRKLWRRELQALAEGRPTTPWHTPGGLAEMSIELD
jgi:5,5'-dehydrodivanillate O-demethylase